jgi:hypothetical protein
VNGECSARKCWTEGEHRGRECDSVRAMLVYFMG